MSISANIESTITSNISHLYQDPEMDYEINEKFIGNISKDSIRIDGKKYKVIDGSIAVKEKMISSWAQKWLLRTSGALFAAGAAIAIGAAVMHSLPLIALAAIPAGVTSYFSFKSSFNITDEDPHTIASLRNFWNPNKQLHPFSSMYLNYNREIDDLKKFLTKGEISYAFEKQFSNAGFSDITKDIKIEDAHKYFRSERLNSKWKKELHFTSVDTFFNMYDKKETCSLNRMKNLGIISDNDWSKMNSVVIDFNNIEQLFKIQKKETQTLENSVFNQITQTKDLKIRCAKLEHEQNLAVKMRQTMILRHHLSDRETNNQNRLLELGLDIGTYMAASMADKSLENKLIEARVEFEIESRKAHEDFTGRYKTIENERLVQVKTLDKSVSNMISELKVNDLKRLAASC